ncbi:MAG: hypothetical protein ABI595_10690 [Actinomycetota bacterium]
MTAKAMCRRTDTRWFLMSASLFIATACSGVAAERSYEPTTGSTPSSIAEPDPTTASSTDTVVLTIGIEVMGGGDYPSFSVEAPAMWSSPEGHFVVKSGSGVLGMSVWDVGEVPRHPCHWRGRLYDPGPTVDDLVKALARQPLRNSTTPTDVTLGGYRGRYLEWSVPSDMIVTGDADFEACDVEPSNGHRDFVSWLGDGYGERYQQFAGQIDRLWVLDVDGQRLVVDATYAPGTSEADRDELTQIVKSLRVADPAG